MVDPHRLLILLMVLSVGSVWAREPTAPSGLTPAEEAALMKALGADAKERSVKHAGHASPTPSIGGGASMNPDIALILDFAAAYFTADESAQLGAHDPRETGFNLQQLELHVEHAVDPYLQFEANLVFSLFGVELEEAYARTLMLPYGLQMRAGQFFLPFGRANPTHPHAWHFVDQPLMVGKFLGGEGGRGLGVDVSWLAPLPWYTELTVGVTQSAGECCSRSFHANIDAPINGVEDLIGFSRLEQFWAPGPHWGVMLGGSALLGENKTGLGNLTLMQGADLLIRYRPLDSPLRRSAQLQLEWTRRTRQLPGTVITDHGGYADLVVRWSPHWTQGVRWEWVAGRADDPLDPEWTDARSRISAQVTWFPSHFSRLRLQVARNEMKWLAGDEWSAMLALEVMVGAHGAHAY